MTVANAINSWGHDHFNGPFSSTTGKSSPEGQDVKLQFKLVTVQMETPASYNAHIALYEALDSSSGLASTSYLARKSGIPQDKMLSLLKESKSIKKSYLKSSQGDDVYYLDNRLNRLKEGLVYIKQISQLKF